MGRYRLSNAAADDLVAIFHSSLEMFGRAQADSYYSGLEKAFDFLSEYPHAARLRHELVQPVRAHPYKSHLILYEITGDDGIFILRIRHAREDWMTAPE